MAHWGELKCPECADLKAKLERAMEESDAREARLEARIEAMRRDDYSHDAFDQHIAELKGQGDE